jgi:myo-inositol-1(or 4)-monophosphatase
VTLTDNLLPIALAAADIASRTLRDRKPDAVTKKGDRDFASDLDYAIEREIRAFLSEQTPKIGFLGEEEGANMVDDNQPFWALDPVDGTSNLIHGLPMCGTSLGLIHQKQSILGVVDLPFLNERYHAVQSGGAFLNNQPIHASRTTELDGAFIAIGDFAVGTGAEKKNRHRLALIEILAKRAERVRMLGSAATDLVWTAVGRLDASVLLSNKPWDTAAGVVIAREAGVEVVDADGALHDLHSARTIAATPAILPDLLAVLAECSVKGAAR